MSRLTLGPDQTIAYSLIDGDAQKCHLVFLHEGLGCTDMWADFAQRLCRKTGCPGLLYDRIGHGRSSALQKPKTIHYVHADALTELPMVIQTVIPARPYLLIGHSDGGSIALIFAAEKPANLVGIVAEAAHVFVETVTIEGIRAAVEAFDRGKLKSLFDYHGDKTVQLFKAWSETWLSAPFRYWNIEYLLPSVQCPLLVMQGEQDQYGTADQVRTIVSKTAGVAEAFYVKGCGHAPHLEQPGPVINKVARFVEALL